jgi:HK97 family phage prohead protease
VNDLPDSAFLYIAPGGAKDGSGKTMPRSLRYFPVRDANGAVDEAHVANALARIPQASSLSPDARAAAMTKAKALAARTNVSGPVGTYAGSAGSGRSVPSELMCDQQRTFSLVMELRDQSGDGRTLYCRAIPYNTTVEIDGGRNRERFVPGVFSRQISQSPAEHVKFYDAHDARMRGQLPIGKGVRMAEQPDGLYGEWHLFDTSKADDALKLIRAGEVTGLSIGFRSAPNGSRRMDDGIIERQVAHLDHIALTHEPAYADAAILAVRSIVHLPEYDAERERLRALVGA